MALASSSGDDAMSGAGSDALDNSTDGIAMHVHRRQSSQKGKRKMAENSGHAPGHEISGEGDAVRQRFRMGEGKGTMKGESFGVESFSEANRTGGKKHGSGSDGATLKDSERCGPPAISNGSGMMSSSAHSKHGDH